MGTATWVETKGEPAAPNPPPPNLNVCEQYKDDLLQRNPGSVDWHAYIDRCWERAALPPPPLKEVKRGVWFELTCIDCGQGQWSRVVDGKQETLLTPLPPEPKEETTALVTADECLRVIEAYQKEKAANDLMMLKDGNCVVPPLDPLASFEKAAIKASKALQILLTFPMVRVSGDEDND